MRPYISQILEHNGKTYLLPVPSKYRELLDCVHTLGLKDEADEDDMKLVGYKTLYIPEPDAHYPLCYIEDIGKKLSEFTEEQAKMLGAFCDTFALSFANIAGLIEYFNDKNIKESAGDYDYDENED